jgi:negative regulator of sigma E activity
MTDETKISRRYRELAREEPPREIDEAILAAARRATDVRPAPLVVPSGRRRWYFPLAAAAVIVLAVAVTVHVERQQRDVDVAEALVPSLADGEEKLVAESKRATTPDPK